MGLSLFNTYIGIDYSGAETPISSLKGLRVYRADQTSPPAEVLPPPSPRRYWTRRGLADWLVERLSDKQSTLIGIDHGFSFPLSYFDTHHLKYDWPAFLDDFQRHWPTDGDFLYVESIREGVHGLGAERSGDTRWRRLTDIRSGAKSVFHFDVPGQVAKSTYAGLPWLRYIRRRTGDSVHFWPFDGFDLPAQKSVIAEVYPSCWRRSFPQEDRTPDQHDAYSIAAWMQRADRDGHLSGYLHPSLNVEEKRLAQIEGWILGTM